MRSRCFVVVFGWLPALVFAQPAAPTPTPSAVAPATDDLYAVGKQLFDQLAPPEIKEQYEFPSKAQWDESAKRMQHALEGDDLRALAAYAPEARSALTALRAFPEYSDYADWLATRLDEIEGAEQVSAPSPTPRANVPQRPGSPIPHYALWLARVRAHELPARAAELMPHLRAAFVAERVPPELAWLAEAESSMNPNARSPVGARGLFQLMPETAKELGLDTFMPDERTNPEKSARAAARLLRENYEKFGSWPLALAAYNAGPGKITRLLEKTSAKNYAGIAAALPAETRMYVPKVCAIVATRTGVEPEKIPPPRT